MDILIRVLQMLFALSLMVGIHEAGHMLFAKLFGMRVEKFFIGFNPKIFSRKIGETEYGIGAIPLGGYVKITGMIDESLDTEQLKSEPKPYEFRAKPAWQRLLVMLGGIIFNVVTGVIFSIIVLFTWGQSYTPYSEMEKHGILAGEIGKQIGLKDGDKITKVNGEPLTRVEYARNPDVLLADDPYYIVQRDGAEERVDIPGNTMDLLSDHPEKISALFTLPLPFKVGKVVEKLDDGIPAPGYEAGLQAGDQIISMEDTTVRYFQDIVSRLKHFTNQEISLSVLRNGDTVNLICQMGDEPKIGFSAEMLMETEHEDIGLVESIPKGIAKAFGVLSTQGAAFGKMASGDLSVSKSLSGPLGIVFIFPPEWNWQFIWNIIAMLSMVLALMNLLPIPALDGGHVVFLLYEIISGRKPSDKFLIVAQYVGMIFLLLLIVFVTSNDIWKHFLR